MAKSGGARGRPMRPARGKRPAATSSSPRRPAPKPSAAPPPAPAVSGPFRLGAIPGATPGTWIDRWKERMPQQPLELVPLSVAGQREALLAGDVDAALVRLPIDRDGLDVIALYDEVSVAVVSSDSHLTVAEDLGLADLVGEVVIVPRDDVLGLDVAGAVAPVFAAPDTTEDAVATVASGVGLVIVPMSLARLHHRKDAAHRAVRDAPVSTVALAWIAGEATPSIEAFIGIVRGRTANSSRS